MAKAPPPPADLLNEEQVLIEEMQALRAHDPNFKDDPSLTPASRLHAAQTSALCLSGGGIRSATFNLGILQGLARQQLLEHFDYLSTVSGGGYIGGWLTSWITRHRDGAAGAIHALRTRQAPEADELSHLRTYSNYLTPKLGLFSGDTLTLVKTYLRNLFINWMALLPLLMSIVLLPRLFLSFLNYGPAEVGGFWSFAFPATAAVCIVLGLRWINVHRPDRSKVSPRHNDQPRFLAWCLVPLVLGAILLAISWAWWARSVTINWWFVGGLVVAGALLHTLGVIAALLPPNAIRLSWREAGNYPISGALAGLMGALFAWNSFPDPLATDYNKLLYASFSVPLLIGIFLLSGTMVVGFISRRTTDEDREWWARAGGWLIAVMAAWSILAPLVLFAREIVLALSGWLSSLGGISGLIAVVGGFSGLTGGLGQAAAGRKTRDKLLSLLVQVAAAVFILALLVFLAFLVEWIKTGIQRIFPMHIADNPQVAVIVVDWVLFVLFVLMAIGVSLAIDLNKFSLHAMYRLRLMRAYLGATNPQRTPVAFTGFDPTDNLSLHELWPNHKRHNRSGQVRVDRPLHIVNVALNTVADDNLAWQQRKATSFTFSPLHCGGKEVMYRRSKDYGDGVTLATAMTISGAAVSPRMGYHSSPLVAFLLTLFNVRLGWWLGNPNPDGKKERFRESAPRDALWPLVSEMFGLSGIRSQYVYLSDGGHFDNLGLYEMVRRRCRHIVVIDAGCDLEVGLSDFGNAIRRVRVDFGVPIELLDEFLIKPRPTAEAKYEAKGVYCAVATVRYGVIDQKANESAVPDGSLVYIKPSLYGREPIDVASYAKSSCDFPHESTRDQFFSESQFESYRALGEFIIETFCSQPRWANDLPSFVKQARTQIWQTPNGGEPLGISSIDPATGDFTGDTRVTILGTGFLPDLEVQFGSVRANDWLIINSKKIVATTPRLEVGAPPLEVDVILARPNDDRAISPTKFTYR